MDGIKTLVSSPDSVLRTAASETFVRLMRLALLYRDGDLSPSIQSKWLTRIHWHDLPPTPALVVADAYDLRHLLCHAYYVHLVNVSPRIVRSQSISAGSPLTPTQNLHVFCGYHSLLACWRQLQESAPLFTPVHKCVTHSRCLIAWNARWALETGRETTLSPVDVLCRLLVMERNLEADGVLRECMHEGCRLEALETIAKKRAEISDNLHHHFDL
jgi:hypothetical protein